MTYLWSDGTKAEYEYVSKYGFDTANFSKVYSNLLQ